ncbi:hypothetical protein HDV05_005033 [Chytridiales sp. JEL 0842]|nr:hypothetical protein HDV05_005033 [Chytridiales sp. JEL 0842]
MMTPSLPHMSSSTVAFSIAAAALASLLAYDNYYIRKNAAIPGPPRYPFIGSILYSISYLIKGKSHDLHDKLHKKYGPIVAQSLFGIESVQIADPDFITKQFPALKRAELSTSYMKGIVKYALFLLPNEEIWKKHRKYIQPGFGPTHLRQVVDGSNHAVNILCSLWDTKTVDTPTLRIDLFHVATSMTLDVVGLMAFSYSYDSVTNIYNPEKQTAVRTFNRASAAVLKRVVVPHFLWGYFGLSEEQIRKEMSPIRDALLNAIRAKRAALNHSTDECSMEPERGTEDMFTVVRQLSSLSRSSSTRSFQEVAAMDLLDRLLEVEGWSDDEIMDEVYGLFLAGGETTANSIVFTILELSRHPHVLQKLRDELDKVLGPFSESEEITQSTITFDDTVNNLPYLDYVIKETQRLHAVLPQLPARIVDSPQGLQVGSHHIQQGTYVFADVRSLHLSPKYWESPCEFKPERWEAGFKPLPGTYLPFGEGPQKCVGNKMAILELKVMVGRLVHRYDIKVVEGLELDLVTSVTHGYKNGIMFDVSRRQV